MTEPGTPAERLRLTELENRLDFRDRPAEEILELALLYMEPFHQEDRGLAFLEALLERDPSHAQARIWLAYWLQHHGLDEKSLRRGLDVLQPLLSPGAQERGAALLLSALISSDLGELNSRGMLPRLEESIREEPDWVSNRKTLADTLAELGEHEAAVQQARLALARVVPRDPSWDGPRDLYETFITWRASHRMAEWLEQDIRRLEKLAGSR